MPNRRRRRWVGKRVREMRTREGEINCCLAQSHIDSLHRTEPLGYYSHTGLDNFTHPKHIHTHTSRFQFSQCARGRPYCTWCCRVEACSPPSEIKKEEASVQNILGVPPTLCAIHVVNTYRQCTACQRQGIPYSEYKKAEVRET